ncbi:SDR family NAD(P)-dependent oxidoreductase [Alicyclobacillus sp. ALC3]|uniref:SDR family NAD(P)-dependent oxidoreductase n=1 Tax=Alicyclobacillus sp. ALC3 TaxID=2796143 RepID=UPI0023792731|nr:3-oxoacyl-ACP reductase family protein [Alicyclobacillus sp. ALC3]WDL95956.1 3-oxoacyl-ACP reductase FabG [Alicyclobacillus sp. ALC3]
MSNSARVALVTGASRGLGRAIALNLADNGYHVVVNYRTSGDEAEGVVHDITAAGGAASPYRADVSIRTDVARMVEDVTRDIGPIKVLVNNAGLNIDRPFLEITPDEWTRVVQVNLDGTFHCTQLVAKSMLHHGVQGSIVNLSASTAISGRKDGANYCASKAGVIALTKCTALELAPHIRVNCVLPGYIETQEVVERFSLDDETARERVMGRIPMNRLGQPEEIAEMVTFLCSEKATYITGQQFFVNGGNYTG